MNVLLTYLNTLSDEARQNLAASCGTSVGYLRKACCIGQKLGPALCVSIERASGGAVTRQDLRQDDWRMIWPELAEQQSNAEHSA